MSLFGWLTSMFKQADECAKDVQSNEVERLRRATEGRDSVAFLFACAPHRSSGDEGALAEWIRKGAEQGDDEFQFALGRCYSDGRGLEQNYEEAVHWYRKAAEQGHPEAQYFMGLHYYEGEGVAQSDAEMIAWWRKAAEQGHKAAIKALEYY